MVGVGDADGVPERVADELSCAQREYIAGARVREAPTTECGQESYPEDLSIDREVRGRKVRRFVARSICPRNGSKR